MLDSQVKQVVELFYSMEVPEFSEELSVEEAREVLTRFSNPPLKSSEELPCKIKEHIVPTRFKEIKVRGYYPHKRSENAPILYFRGSGFIVDNLNDSDRFCMRLAEAAQTFVLSVDYPLAPEFPYPSSLEACYQVYLWAIEHTEFANLDSAKMILLGESSGACLAACLTQMIRDKEAVMPGYQILLYPIADVNFKTDSYQKMESGYIMTRQKIQWYLKRYLSSLQNAKEPYALPMNIEDLKGLPKTLIITAEFDPLRDDGLHYANKLKSFGNDCEYLCISGMIHGFLKFDSIKRATEAFDILTSRIRQFLSS